MILLLSITLHAQTTLEHEMDDVIVTAGRTPVTFSDITRTVTIITKDDIKNTPFTSIPEILQYVSGIDVKQQNAKGLQADVSIRGGSFEQTLILLDGIKLTDPQTGHHNMSLPVSLDEIEKIEILKGPGSQIFGANAFSGVINIITKKGNSASFSLLAEGGQYGFTNFGVSGSYKTGVLTNVLSISRRKSDGYIHNTDFDVFNISYRPNIVFKNGAVNLFAGYTDNEFGANGFYGNYPNQREHIKTTLLSVSSELGYGRYTIVPKVYWRQNEDEYIFDYINYPVEFINKHKTNVYGGELQTSLNSSIGVSTLGGEYGKDKVESSNLGDHNREKYGFFLEQKFSSFSNFTANFGLFSYKYASIGWRVWPGLDLGYKLGQNTRLYASYGKAFRIPSYTELYYNSRTTVGNANLEHETEQNYEIGFYFGKRIYDLNVSMFYKDGKNLIDYVENPVDNKWYAENITEIKTTGFEFNFTVSPTKINGNFFIEQITLAYTFLDINKKDQEFRSRYALENLKHQGILGIYHKIPFDIYFNWKFKVEQRIDTDVYFLTDLNIGYEFDYFNIFMKGTNIFNTPFTNIFGLEQPGRWFFAGIKFGL